MFSMSSAVKLVCICPVTSGGNGIRAAGSSGIPGITVDAGMKMICVRSDVGAPLDGTSRN